MRQEVGWFEVQNQVAVATDFEINTMAYQLAVGEKISTIIMVLSMVFAGLGLSLYIGWILTLVILGFTPVIIVLWSKVIASKV
jgi:ATP-binding cassette, subfamily B (MDR/TAP), member 1